MQKYEYVKYKFAESKIRGRQREEEKNSDLTLINLNDIMMI